jgi:hypothetical protein
MRLTIFILFLPVAAFFGGILAVDRVPIFQGICFFTWLLSAVVSFIWGFYISRRSRLLGWLCVGVGISPLILMMWPVISA